MPFVAWAALRVMAFALCPICAQLFPAWRDLLMRRICRVTRPGGGCRRGRTRIVVDGANFRSASAGHAVYRFRRRARLTRAKLRAMLGLPFHACLSEEDVAWTFLSRLPNK